MKHKEQILKLRSEGKTYRQIREITGASKGTISYHCNDDQKLKHKESRERNLLKSRISKKINRFKEKTSSSINRVLSTKVRHFNMNRKTKKDTLPSFTLQDVIDKFGDNPMCYLTGKSINLYDSKSYNFDHIIPISRGGSNDLDNLGLATPCANSAKSDKTPEEFLELCKCVLVHFGYTISKP